MASLDEFLQNALNKKVLNDAYSRGSEQDINNALLQTVSNPYSAAKDSQAARELSDAYISERNASNTPLSMAQDLLRLGANAGATALEMPTSVVSGMGTALTEAGNKLGLIDNDTADNFRSWNQELNRSAKAYTDPIREAVASSLSKWGEQLEQASNERDSAIHAVEYQEAIAKGESETLAALSKFGKDFMSSARNAFKYQDPSQVLGTVIGSIGGTSAAIKGAVGLTNKAIFNPVDKAATEALFKSGVFSGRQAAKRRSDIAKEGSKLGTEFSTASAIGAMAANPQLIQAYDRVKEIPLSELRGNENWNNLLKEFDGNTAKAKEAMALRVASQSAAVSDFITGFAATRLGLGHLYTNPWLKGTNMSAKDAAKLIIGSNTVQDINEAATPQAVSNLAIKQYKDSQDITEGVAQAAGAVLPATVAGAGVRTPAIANKGAKALTDKVTKTIDNVKAKANDILNKEIDGSSPTSNETVREKAEDIIQRNNASAEEFNRRLQAQRAAAQQNNTTVESSEQDTKLKRAINAVNHHMELNQNEMNNLVQEHGMDANRLISRPHAQLAIAEDFAKAESPEEQRRLISLFNQLGESGHISEEQVAEIGEIAQSDPAMMQMIQEANSLSNAIKSTPLYAQMVDIVNKANLDELIPEQVSQENAQEVADTIAMAASTRIDDINPQAVNNALKHSTVLSHKARATLEVLQEYFNTTAESMNVDEGNGTVKVQKQVFSDLGDYIKEIAKATAEGNQDAVANSMRDLRGFAESQNNKLAALNQGAKESNHGKDISFTSFNPKTKTHFKTKEGKGIWFQPSNTASVNNAKAISTGSRGAVTTYNELVKKTGIGEAIKPTEVSSELAKYIGSQTKFKPDANAKQAVKSTSGTKTTPKEVKADSIDVSGLNSLSLGDKKDLTSNQTNQINEATKGNEWTAAKKNLVRAIVRRGETVDNAINFAKGLSELEAKQSVDTINKAPNSITTTTNEPTKEVTKEQARVDTRTDEVDESLLPPKLKTKPNLSKHIRDKDIAKSNQANQFIGDGVVGSSTALYEESWGNRANTGKYTDKSKIFVSVNGGKQGQESFNRIKDLLNKAIEAGATLITDTKEYAENSSYNTGEKLLRQYLESKGYADEGTGIWTKAKPNLKEEEVNETRSDTEEIASTEPVLTRLVSETSKLIPKAKERLQRLYKPANAEKINHHSSVELFNAIKERDPKLARQIAEIGKQVTPALQSALNRFFEKNPKAKEMLDNDDAAPLNWKKGRILTFLERGESGNYRFNPEVVRMSMLATLDYMFNEGQEAGTSQHKDSLREAFGESLDEADLATLSKGLLAEDFIGGIANNLRRFLNIKTDNDAPLGEADGAIQALASEMANLFIQREGDKPNDLSIYKLQRIETANDARYNLLTPIQKADSKVDTTAIRAAMFPQRSTNSSLEPIKNQERTIKRHQTTPLTKEQEESIQKHNDVEYFREAGMMNLVTQWSEDEIVDLLAPGVIEEGKANINTIESNRGKRLSVLNAVKAAINFDAELNEVANGRDINSIPRYFKNFISAEGRVHQEGGYTPQGSTVMRYLMMATKSTVDMNDPQYQRVFNFALAQAFGFDKKKVDDNISDFRDFLNKDLKSAYSGIRQALKEANNDSSKMKLDASKLKASFEKAGITPDMRMIHALIEKARFDLSSEKDRANFTTTLHVEADGKTNGPWNLINMYSVGEFTTQELDNLERGGLTFGEANRSLQDSELPDLYNTVRVIGNEYINGHRRTALSIVQEAKFYQSSEKGKATSNSWGNIWERNFTHLIETLSDIGFTKDGDVDGERGFYKGPTTQLGYYASPTGLANGMTKDYMQSIYSKISDAINLVDSHNMSVAKALAQVGLSERMLNDMAVDATQIVIPMSEKSYVKPIAEENNKPEPIRLKTRNDLVNFTFTYKQKKVISRAIFEDIAYQTYSAGKRVFGEAVSQATEDVVNATQLLGKYVKAKVQQAITNELDRLKKEEGRNAQDYLSRNELNAVLDSLKPLFLAIEDQGQQVALSGLERAVNTSSRSIEISSTMDEQLASYITERLPGEVGVSAIAKSTIGLGDGNMMSELSEDMQKTTNVFDGWLSGIADVMRNGVRANEAALKASRSNPFTSIYDLMKRIKDVKGLTELILKDKNYINSLVSQNKIEEGTVEALEGYFNELFQNIGLHNQSRIDRIKALEQVPGSADQMAGTQTPFNFGENHRPMSREEVLNTLNAAYKGKSVSTVAADPESKVQSLIDRLDGKSEISKLLKDLLSKTDPDKLPIIEEVDHISSPNEGEVTHGIYSYGTNTIQITPNVSQETLAHELIHALTFEVLLDHYYGNKVSGATKTSIGRIEKLLDIAEKRLRNAKDLTPEEAVSLSNMLYTLDHYTGDHPTDKAARLNEFMAWGLANKEVTSKLKETNVPKSVFKKLANKVAEHVRQLFSSIGIKLGDSAYDKLLFNTAVVAQEIPSRSELASETMLRHAEKANMPNHLAQLREFFASRLISNIKDQTQVKYGDNKISDEIAEGNTRIAIDEVLIPVTNEYVAAFNLTPEEATTMQMVMGAIQTESKINSTLRDTLTDLHAQFLQAVDRNEVENSVDSNDPMVKGHYGLTRYNLLTGVGVSENTKDLMMPGFFALAMVNPSFKGLLNSMEITKYEKSDSTSIDNFITTHGVNALNSLAARLSGLKEVPKDMGEAIDAIEASWVKAIEKENQASTLPLLDKAGEFISDVNDRLASAIQAGGTKLKESSNKYISLLGRAITDTIGVEELITDASVKTESEAYRSFLKDILGRTESNGDVYDLIKLKTNHQKRRQQYRTDVPKLIAKKFSRELDATEWKHLNDLYSKVDITSIDPRNITNLAQEIKDAEKAVGNAYAVSKAKQLANFRNTGKTGKDLRRNADLILLGREGNKEALNKLINLYTLDGMPKETKDFFNIMKKEESKALDYIHGYISNTRNEESKGIDIELAKLNGDPSYIPNLAGSGQSLIIADPGRHKELLLTGYTFAGEHPASGKGKNPQMAYYYAPVGTKAGFNQGAIQNIVATQYGLRANGRTYNSYDQTATSKGNAAILPDQEGLVNIYNSEGKVIGQEWIPSSEMLALVQKEDNLAANLGIWKGRQIEQGKAAVFNEVVGDTLAKSYNDDINNAGSPRTKADRLKSYVDIADIRNFKDKPIRDALSIIPQDVMNTLKKSFGDTGHVWVRRDILEDIIGIRNPSITDPFTGISRWSPEVQKEFRLAAVGMLGKDAYIKLMKAEKAVQNVVGILTENIVVRSLKVPAANIISNIGQLKANGVPIKNIVQGIAKYTAETNTYSKYAARLVELDVELSAVKSGSNEEKRLNAEKQSLEKAINRLSIAPLIEAGEFNTIADLGITAEDGDITTGKLDNYVATKIKEAPKPVAEAIRQGFIMKDTALYKALEKTVLYGDFVAKAILHEHLTKKKGLSEKESLAKVTDEFVNYDLQMGRTRKGLESYGLAWFYNYKIRSTKVGLRLLRDNPLNLILSTYGLQHSPIDGTGTPLNDSVVWKGLVSGTLGYSLGPQMGLNLGIRSNPAMNLLP